MEPHTRKERVGILIGGRSVEHEISVITGLQLIDALDVERFEPLAIYVSLDGRWFVGDALYEKSFYKTLPAGLSKLERVALLPEPGLGGLVPYRHGRFDLGSVIKVDIYIPAFHGSYGEDGCIQGLLELADVTYTGSRVLASALGMDKFTTKRLVSSLGVPVLPGHVIEKERLLSGLASIRRDILCSAGLENFPLFVKPCNSGSSVGISRVETEPELDAALLKVFDVDLRALVEPCVTNPLEINVSIMEGSEVRASVVEIPVVQGGGLLTYEQKYMRSGGTKSGTLADGMAGASRIIDPVDLPAELKQQAISYALQVFKALGCSGVARIDFLCDSKGMIYFNEINTLPGSLAYYLWARTTPRLLYTELLNEMIHQAKARRTQAQQLRRDFGFKSLSAGVD